MGLSGVFYATVFRRSCCHRSRPTHRWGGDVKRRRSGCLRRRLSANKIECAERRRRRSRGRGVVTDGGAPGEVCTPPFSPRGARPARRTRRPRARTCAEAFRITCVLCALLHCWNEGNARRSNAARISPNGLRIAEMERLRTPAGYLTLSSSARRSISRRSSAGAPSHNPVRISLSCASVEPGRDFRSSRTWLRM